ncbi:hypothetical protein VB779_00030 [Haloarculaceae archaeon H-GB11]|nr:hypothetical protein [Haloarculaceae archaeon H-GB1-1]MEA5385674.1 hypothetical protein [Haloarculaceae archaeon H-GB11]
MLREILHSVSARLTLVPDVPDLVLALIPSLLSLAWLVGLMSSISMGTAMAAGSVPASGAIGYVLFYEPPERVRSN